MQVFKKCSGSLHPCRGRSVPQGCCWPHPAPLHRLSALGLQQPPLPAEDSCPTSPAYQTQPALNCPTLQPPKPNSHTSNAFLSNISATSTFSWHFINKIHLLCTTDAMFPPCNFLLQQQWMAKVQEEAKEPPDLAEMELCPAPE